MSLYTWVLGGVVPIGSFLVGATADVHGVSGALLLAGAVGLALLALLAAARPWRALESPPEAHASRRWRLKKETRRPVSRRGGGERSDRSAAARVARPPSGVNARAGFASRPA